VPELDNVIANLELLPLALNQRKNSKIGDRQRDLTGQLLSTSIGQRLYNRDLSATCRFSGIALEAKDVILLKD
jgi:hypothetical protein